MLAIATPFSHLLQQCSVAVSEKYFWKLSERRLVLPSTISLTLSSAYHDSHLSSALTRPD